MRTAWRQPKLPASSDVAARPSVWNNWHEAVGIIGAPRHLRKTVGVALVVGTVLFLINQLDVVLRHDATTVTYLKVALTYLVPFCVSNYGVLVATRRPTRARGGTHDANTT